MYIAEIVIDKKILQKFKKVLH